MVRPSVRRAPLQQTLRVVSLHPRVHSPSGQLQYFPPLGATRSGIPDPVPQRAGIENRRTVPEIAEIPLVSRVGARRPATYRRGDAHLSRRK